MHLFFIAMQCHVLRFAWLQKVSYARGAWSKTEDCLLLKRYDRLGPAWDLVKLAFEGRKPQEIRRRWMILSGMLDRWKQDKRIVELLKAGYEPHTDPSNKETKEEGRLRFIKFPIEDPGLSPFRHLCSMLHEKELKDKTLRGLSWSKHRALGWSPEEQRALQQGYDELGPNWTQIAKSLGKRTPNECKRFLERRSARVVRKIEIRGKTYEMPPDLDQEGQLITVRYVPEHVQRKTCSLMNVPHPSNDVSEQVIKEKEQSESMTSLVNY